MSHIVVVDYGMGNLRSVQKALEHVAPTHHVEVSADPVRVQQADRVVFPGQGAMPDCIREIDARGLRPALLQAAQEKPFLGICIGLQLLFGASEEGESQGLGVLPGAVRRFGGPAFAAHQPRLKIPHMGWNEVEQTQPHALWQGIESGSRFYFVHSYHVVPDDSSLVAGVGAYPGRFCCAVARGQLFAVQFHPEKSAQAGLTLLANFVGWTP